MAEKAELTTPSVTSHTITDYSIDGIGLFRRPWRLTIHYRDNPGNLATDEHLGSDAEAFVKAFNKANLSVKSAERRALEHLVSCPKIAAATVTGNPD